MKTIEMNIIQVKVKNNLNECYPSKDKQYLFIYIKKIKSIKSFFVNHKKCEMQQNR